MTQKVFMVIETDNVKCYANLKQLTDDNNLPYFPVMRRLRKSKYTQYKNITITYDTINYTTKRKGRSYNGE